ncbi:MerR family DNA-binding transcriptional regulator [Sporosarcina sp. FSL K6-3457]
MYLSTGELSKRLKVSVRTLRYYDQIGLVHPS